MVKRKYKWIFLCLSIAIPSCFLGKAFPIIGGGVFAILIGIIIALFLPDKGNLKTGIKFTSKKILQWAVILLGFGLNLGVIVKTVPSYNFIYHYYFTVNSSVMAAAST